MSKTDDSLEAIAVIGLSGRFPGARSVDQFWHNLRNGVESIHRYTDQELESLGITPDVYDHPNYVKAGTVLENVDMFDAEFFGFYPKEAEIRDPQHRLFLECAWEAIENAGYDLESYRGQIGVFGGCGPNYYGHMIPFDFDPALVAEAFQREIGAEKDYLCTLVSYKLGLKGPAVTIQTACSTSLVAVCLACQSLMTYQCDMALAGGVCVNTRQRGGYFYQEGMIPSPDGHCRAFDARAQGTVLGQGTGVVLLKRLSEALVDADNIYAVIRGFAINNDGSEKVGYTAPSVNGQAEVIAMAQALSGIPPESISYIEAHGTGTPLGDPIEIAALNKVFREHTEKKTFCAIGSLKTNIGHLDAAAGVAGLIKTVLTLKNREIPPSLHFKTPNPDIDFADSPFYVNTKLRNWSVDGLPLRAGVSSFGIGGTNAHVVLEEAPFVETSGESRPWHLLLLSAKTSTALDTMTTNLVDHLKQHLDIKLADIAYTLQVGRKTFSHRRMIVCKSLDDAVTALDILDPKHVTTSFQEPINRDVVFMLSGQASQYVNMGLELYRTESQFQEHIDRCSEILRPHLSLDLRDILYPEGEDLEELARKLEQTSITQPALFTIEYALAKLWMSWGVQPAAMVGHSIGEYVAACIAGVFSLEDALTLVAARGRLMQELPGGSMLAVFLSEKKIQPFLNKELTLAVINGPSLCVVSGKKGAVEDLEKQLSKRNVDCRHLHTSHAFHSKMMDPIVDSFAEQVKQVKLNPPQIPFLSNVTGTWISTEEATNPGYWAKHLRQTVRFSDCARELLKEPNRIFLEVGPGITLSTLVSQHPDKKTEQLVVSSIRHPKEKKSDIAFILNTLGRLWLAGIQVDWSAFYANENRYRIPLPTYPFERKRYWIEAERKGPATAFTTSTVAACPAGEMQKVAVFESEVYLEQRTDDKYPAISRNNIEQTIANMWQDLLGIDEVRVHDDFFDLGGSSLVALILFAQIERIFGKKLPLATLYEAPTLGQLAGILSEEEWAAPWASVVEIQSGASKPPFFFVHGAGGNVLIYRDLARYLGSDQPVYGLQSRGLDGEQPFLTRIEGMASHYLKEIQTVQPDGPYFLGGYCMGGSVALEMAQQLYAQGQEVALLALLETYNFSKIKLNSLLDKLYYHTQRLEFHWRNFFLLDSKEKLTFIKEKLKVARARKKVWLGMIASTMADKFHLGNGEASALFNVWDANDRAAFDYVPKVYPGKMTVFRPIREYAVHTGPELGWSRLAGGGLETHRLPVYPAGMLVEPFVPLLAEKLKVCIDEALKIESSK